MSKIIEEIDLESYSIEELSILIEMIKKEIDQRGQVRLQHIRIQMERLANSVGMTAEELISSQETLGSDGNCEEVRKIKFRNPADPQ